LHVGVERIDRYIQLLQRGTRAGEQWRWRSADRAGAHDRPLFRSPFFLAAVCNLDPALVAEPCAPLMIVATARAVRLSLVARAAGALSAIDLGASGS
jgi:hypothetical protein